MKCACKNKQWNYCNLLSVSLEPDTVQTKTEINNQSTEQSMSLTTSMLEYIIGFIQRIHFGDYKE